LRSWQQGRLEPKVLGCTRSRGSNRACSDQPNSIRRRPDGKSPKGLAVRSQTGATRIDEPPYRAYPVTCGITLHVRGVEINRNAQ